MSKCIICGKEISNKKYNTDICSSECFSINFWNKTLDDEAIIINGECYHVGNEKSTSPFRGFAGRKFYIQLLNNNQIIKTTNLWYNGVIPESHHKDDNAKFLSDNEYKSITSNTDY